MTVGTALSSAKCTSRRRGAPGEACAAARGPRSLAAAPVVVAGRAATPPGERSRGPSAALFVQICCKGPHRAGTREKNRWYSAVLLPVDPVAERLCNRFGQPPAPDRPRSPTRTSAAAPHPHDERGGGPAHADPRPAAPHPCNRRGRPAGEELRGTTAPRAGGLTRRARVCCALRPLLRSFTLRCTRRRSAAEGEEAQQTERGAADGAERPPRGRESHGHRDRLPRAPGRGPPAAAGAAFCAPLSRPRAAAGPRRRSSAPPRRARRRSCR